MLAAPALVSAATPRAPRIVSINPCLDAVLVRVADAAQIASISAYSQDARSSSIPLALARRFRANAGTAEEVVALRPDLVVAGGHVAPATVAALARLRVPLAQFAVPATVEESVAQVRDLAARVGHPARGAALAARIEAAARPARVTPVPALIFGAGGLVPGAGTLPDDLLTRAGFRNASAGYGLARWDVLPLEHLVAAPPRVLFSVAAAEDAGGGGGERAEHHPALRRLAPRLTTVPFPARLMNCGGPTIVEAMALLRAARARFGEGR
ncbi:ABC transporter substrate-binding protein [Sphingomonas sp. BK580]|uniref:ABC transporter substrate-binding protein n=1 Tax=Sphingomonas sp. BK580 TaxID=2586972 RepID=UPI001793737C|nr:ABC transporter substrate-binding protein [Sphingomonas sp. BK580]MBB3693497.1 iron complex transport system substrate-binding protein [Sphingomonas sp. BK580]